MPTGLGLGLGLTFGGGGETGAATLVGSYDDGFAVDFTDASVFLRDSSTPSNNIDSSGRIDGSGALIGPGAALTNTSPAVFSALQSDGFHRFIPRQMYLNSAAPANQSITVVVGRSYNIVITGSVSISLSGAASGTVTAGTTSFTAATTTLTCGSTSGSGTVHVYPTPNDTGYLAAAGAITSDLPYEWSIAGKQIGIRADPTATNKALHSTDVSNAAWTKFNATVSDDVAAGPIEGFSYDKIVEDSASSAAHGIYQTQTTTIGVRECTWCIVKAAERSWIYMTEGNNVTATAYFNIGSGAVGTVSGTGSPTGRIKDLGDGWYLCQMSFTPIGAASNFQIRVTTGDTIFTHNGDGASGVLFAHGQFETGPEPTSIIITHGAEDSRALIQLTRATSAIPFSTTVGTIYAAFTVYDITTDIRCVVQIDDGTNNNVIGVYQYQATAGAFVANGGTTVADQNDAVAVGQSVKVAMSWAANDILFSIDGVTQTPDTSAAIPTGLTTLRIGHRAGPANGGNMTVKEILEIPQTSSQATLNAMTA